MKFVADDGKVFDTLKGCEDYEQKQKEDKYIEERKKNELANEFAKIENAAYVVNEMAKDFEKKSGEHITFYINREDGKLCVKRYKKCEISPRVNKNKNIEGFSISELFGLDDEWGD